MRVASFFAGIGGFDLGFEKAGMEIVFQCENYAFAQSILEAHWPDVPRHGDIQTLNASEVPDADLYCGGFPCQDVSLANQGKRKGINGTRSGLFFKFAELIEANKPRWVVLENVLGLLNSQEGRDFRVVIGTLDEIGYGVAWRVFDAKYFGTPQRRRRVFIVGSYQSLSAATVLFDDRAVGVTTETSKGKKATTAERHEGHHRDATLYTIQHAAIGRKHTAGPQGRGYRNDGETWTLDRRGRADALCSANDAFRIRGFTGISKGLDRRRYRVLGDAVCVPVVEWLGKRLMAVEDGQIPVRPELYPEHHAAQQGFKI